MKTLQNQLILLGSLLLMILLTNLSFAQQPTGKAFYSNGLVGAMSIPDTSALEYNGDTLAIEAWIHQCETDSAQVIMGKQWCTLNTEWVFSVANGRVRWSWSKNGHCSNYAPDSTDGYYAQTRNPMVTPGTWTHVAVMHTRSGIHFWVNGVAVPDTDIDYYYFNDPTVVPKPTDPNEYTIFKGDHDIQIGAYKRWDGVQGAFIKGYLDQVAVWTTLPPNLATRTTTELDRNAPGLVCYFDMENYINQGLATHRFFDVDGQAPVLTASRINGGPYTVGTIYDFPDSVSIGPDTSIAQNTTIDLRARIHLPPAATYLWDDGSTDPVRTINMEGIYWVQVDFGFCSWVDTIVVLPILPIDLTWFHATPGKEGVRLNWGTEEGSFDRTFTVQRSGDGIHFQDLTLHPGATGQADFRQYHSVDREPLRGTSFYRLHMVDTDGAIEFSEVRTVKWDPAQAFDVTLYPNPAEGNCWLELFEEVSGPVRISLVNLAGKVVREQQWEKNNINRVEIELTEVPAGLYMLRVYADGKAVNRRLMVR